MKYLLTDKAFRILLERESRKMFSCDSNVTMDGSVSFTDDQVEELCETFKTVRF